MLVIYGGKGRNMIFLPLLILITILGGCVIVCTDIAEDAIKGIISFFKKKFTSTSTNENKSKRFFYLRKILELYDIIETLKLEDKIDSKSFKEFVKELHRLQKEVYCDRKTKLLSANSRVYDYLENKIHKLK
jgi:flagellar motor component MotA